MKSNEGYFGTLFRHGDFLKFENITRIYSSFSVYMLSLVMHLDQWHARENITKLKKKETTTTRNKDGYEWRRLA